MGYIPIFLDVTGRECVVVGGGEVAARKVEALLEAGARVTVVSPRLSSQLQSLAARGLVTHIARDYERGDIHGCVLVYAATGDPKLHRELAAEARALGIPINVVDVPELCTFISPAVVKRGRASDRNLDRRRVARICCAPQARVGGSVRRRVRAHARSVARGAATIACRGNRSDRSHAPIEGARRLRAARRDCRWRRCGDRADTCYSSWRRCWSCGAWTRAAR